MGLIYINLPRRPEIRELELNPVILYPQGYIAVDARIFLERPGGKGAGPSPELLPRRDPGSLRPLFYPESLAVIVASDKPGKLG